MMNALEKIIAEIGRQAQAKADGILEEARQKAAEISAKGDAARAWQQHQLEETAEQECRAIMSRAESADRQNRRRAVLQAHHEVIDEVLAEAKAKITGLPDDDYFDFLFRLFEKNAQPKDGIIRFAPKDAQRLPDGFIGRCKKVFPDHTLKLSDDTAGIENGFVIEYGPIIQNCSIEGIFETESQTLREKAYDILSAASQG